MCVCVCLCVSVCSNPQFLQQLQAAHSAVSTILNPKLHKTPDKSTLEMQMCDSLMCFYKNMELYGTEEERKSDLHTHTILNWANSSVVGLDRHMRIYYKKKKIQYHHTFQLKAVDLVYDKLYV